MPKFREPHSELGFGSSFSREVPPLPAPLPRWGAGLYPQVGVLDTGGGRIAFGTICSWPTPNPSPPRWERVTEVTHDSRGRGAILERSLTQGGARSDGGQPLACPGLLSHAPSGLKARSPCCFPLPPVSSEKDIGHDQVGEPTAVGRGAEISRERQAVRLSEFRDRN